MNYEENLYLCLGTGMEFTKYNLRFHKVSSNSRTLTFMIEKRYNVHELELDVNQPWDYIKIDGVRESGKA